MWLLPALYGSRGVTKTNLKAPLACLSSAGNFATCADGSDFGKRHVQCTNSSSSCSLEAGMCPITFEQNGHGFVLAAATRRAFSSEMTKPSEAWHAKSPADVRQGESRAEIHERILKELTQHLREECTVPAGHLESSFCGNPPKNSHPQSRMTATP